MSRQNIVLSLPNVPSNLLKGRIMYAASRPISNRMFGMNWESDGIDRIESTATQSRK